MYRGEPILRHHAMPVRGGPDDVNAGNALADILECKNKLLNREERRVNDIYIAKSV